MPTYVAGDYSPMIGFSAVVKCDDTFDTVTGANFSNPLMITLPKRSWGEFETTKLAQTSDFSRHFLPTLLDNGELKVEGFFAKAEHLRVVKLSGSGGTSQPPVQTWTFTAPDPDGAGALTAMTASFSGWVKEMGEIKFEKDKEVMFDFVIRVTGPVTYNV